MVRIIDADAHFIEPLDLWERYIEPRYRDRCLRFERAPDTGRYALVADGLRTTESGGLTIEELLGVAVGYATLGRIGFEGRYDYGGVGNVVILASRLSDAAADGEILVSQRVAAMLEDRFATDPREPMELKGMSRPVVAHAVRPPVAEDAT